MSGDKCDNCKLFDGAHCRRSPPVRLPRQFADVATPGNRVRDESLIWGWPQVKPGDWCGEHRPHILTGH
jgi:hypothetical protein